MLGINRGRVEPLYHYAARAERDAGIAKWKAWWKANKDVVPEKWFPQYIDGFVATVTTHASRDERMKAARALDRALRTPFGVTSFWDQGYFQHAHVASCALTGDWWATHRGMGRETLVEKALALDVLLDLAGKYQSFLVGAKMERNRPPLALRPKPVKRDQLGQVGKLMAAMPKASAEEKAKAVEQIAAILGTDFAWAAYAADKAFKKELAAIEAYMLDWWDTHKNASPADIQKSLACHVYVIELARRYAELVKKAKTIP